MEKIKDLHLRVPLKDWKFLKQESCDRELSINVIVIEILTQVREKKEKKRLTSLNTVVP